MAVETPKHDFKNIKEAREWAKNIVGTYTNTDTGEIFRISNLSIGKFLSKKAVEKSVTIDAHLSALKQMPSLIETAVLKERFDDKEKNIDIREIWRLYGAVLYENQILPIKITAKIYKIEMSKVYSFEVVDAKNPADERQGLSLPLSYIESLTPQTDD